MSLEPIAENYPKEIQLGQRNYLLRPLSSEDGKALNEFFLALQPQELMYLKSRVDDPNVMRAWCEAIDLGRNFPLLAMDGPVIAGIATLHQHLGGWKRHVGRINVHVHPQHRGAGLATLLVGELLVIARQFGLEKVEAEFFDKQEAAMKLFGLLGFTQLVRLPDHVKDMQSVRHDYILMGLNLKTDEEYTGMG